MGSTGESLIWFLIGGACKVDPNPCIPIGWISNQRDFWWDPRGRWMSMGLLLRCTPHLEWGKKCYMRMSISILRETILLAWVSQQSLTFVPRSPEWIIPIFLYPSQLTCFSIFWHFTNYYYFCFDFVWQCNQCNLASKSG